MAPLFDRAVDSLSAALHPETTRHYRGTVRKFLTYLGAAYPQACSLDQLRRDPHILGWMSCLRSQKPPLATESYINLLIHLRAILQELAWAQSLPELAHLIRRVDVPRRPQKHPRPLTTQQDQLLEQEFLLRNDLGGNVFLLIRHTGMRIGECADLSYDCLRSTGPDQWAVHVPLGKLNTERMVPVDSFVCTLVHRLRFFRYLDPLPADGWLLARLSTKAALVRQLRDYLHQVCHSLGLSTRLVPHQLRHRYASQMVRSGIGLPALMHLLGHISPDMTMRYGRRGSDGSSPRVRLGVFPTPPPCPPAQNNDRLAARRPGRRHRRLVLRSTCTRNVPSRPPRPRFTHSPLPAANRLAKILAEVRKLPTR
jgi:integrase